MNNRTYKRTTINPFLILIGGVLLLFSSGILSGCKPENLGYSNIPEIELAGIEVIQNSLGKDSVIKVSINYQDGDGDIGLTLTDTAAPFNFGSAYYHNLPVTFLVQNSINEYEELKNPATSEPYGNQHERVPNLTPSSKYKTISGTMDVYLTANPARVKPDHVILELKLIDRSLNISNTLTTPIIELNH